MKFKIIGSIIILVIIVIAVGIRGCGNTQQNTDENGNPVDNSSQYDDGSN